MKLKQTELLIATGRATARDFEGMDYADVAQIKAGVPLQMRGLSAGVKGADLGAEGDAMMKAVRAIPGVNGDRLVAYVMSTEDQDRMGDIIRVFGGARGRGWLLEEYEANPVFLWSHESWNPPIGMTRAFWQGRIRQGGVVKNAMLGIVEYFDADVNPFADHVFKMVKADGLMGTSVGFLPVDVIEYNNPQAREAAGLGPYGVEFVTQTLLEDSQAVVPANPFALAAGLKSLAATGEISDTDLDLFAKTYCLTERDHRKHLAERLRSVVDMGAARGVSIQRSIRGRAGDILKAAADEGDPTAQILENARKALDTENKTAQDSVNRGAAVITMDASHTKLIARIPGQDPVEVPEGHSLAFKDGKLVVEKSEGETAPPAPNGAPEGTEQTRSADADPADLLASEDRAVVKSALEGVFDMLAELQSTVGRALDLLESRTVQDSEARAVPATLEEIKGLLAEFKRTAAPLPDTTNRTEAPAPESKTDLDPTQVREFLAKLFPNPSA